MDKLSFAKTSQNLFDKLKANKGVYVNPATGALSTNASYYAVITLISKVRHNSLKQAH